jgi:nucleotide-binding universal stress UspA family protein
VALRDGLTCVNPHTGTSARSGKAKLQEMAMFQHILLATDGSASSRHAAALAVSLAQVHDAKLTALYVADPYPYLGIGEVNPGGMQAYASAGQQLAAEAHAEVDALCRAAPRPVALEVRLVENTTAVNGIVQSAQELGADLIVVGSHGRTGMARLVLGSVAAQVVAQSVVPVLVTR